MDNFPENPQKAKNSPAEAQPPEKNDKSQTREQSGKSGGGGGATKHDDKQSPNKS